MVKVNVIFFLCISYTYGDKGCLVNRSTYTGKLGYDRLNGTRKIGL